MTLYLVLSSDEVTSLLEKLGKHTTAKSCLYIKKLADIDLDVLAQILRVSWGEMAVRYGE
jgi:hypothetical protein